MPIDNVVTGNIVMPTNKTVNTPTQQDNSTTTQGNTTQLDSGNVLVTLGSGTQLTLREPTTLDFLTLQDWATVQSGKGEAVGSNALSLKLSHLCLVSWKGDSTKLPAYDTYKAAVTKSWQDFDTLQQGLDFFRDAVDTWAARY